MTILFSVSHRRCPITSQVPSHTLILLESLFKDDGEPGSIDLGEEDCRFLLDEYNIKLTPSSKGGFICYYGMKTGLAGRGTTRISALKIMMNNLRFKRNKESSLNEDLKLFFNS